MSNAQPSNVLYVGNLPKGASKISLEGLLNTYGVTRLNVREGYGIAEMQSIGEAQRAIQSLNGHDFQGQPLIVRYKTQPQHKNPHQFRQMNSHNSNHSSTTRDAHKSFSNVSPSNIVSIPPQPIQDQQLLQQSQPQQQPQHQPFFQDLSSPQSQMQPNDVRNLQAGIRNLQITNSNHQQKPLLQLDQELKNVQFMADHEKVRHLENIVQLQQNKINKLEAKLEELMDSSNKQPQQHNVNATQAIHRPSIVIPQGSIPMHIQQQVIPQLTQQQAQLAGIFTGHPAQFAAQQPPIYSGDQGPQVAQWGQASASYPPPGSHFISNQPPQHPQAPPGFTNIAAPLLINPQTGKLEPGTFIAAPGFPQNVPLTPVDAINNCFFAAPTPNPSAQTSLPDPGNFQPAQNQIVAQNPRNDYSNSQSHGNTKQNGVNETNQTSYPSNGHNRYNTRNGNFLGNPQIGKSNRILRGGTNRQSGNYRANSRSNNDSGEKPSRRLNNTNGNNPNLSVTNENKTPEFNQPSSVESSKPVETSAFGSENDVHTESAVVLVESLSAVEKKQEPVAVGAGES